MLIQKHSFAFPESQIVVLRDDVQHPDFYPTRANIMRALQWLMMDLQWGDSLFFHFSGHGSQLRDPTGAHFVCVCVYAVVACCCCVVVRCCVLLCVAVLCVVVCCVVCCVCYVCVEHSRTAPVHLNLCSPTQPRTHLTTTTALTKKGMEEDGMDETILPADHQRAGQIRDTELHRALAAPLPQGVTLHALFDCCHSGTVMDLPYETRFDASGAAYWRASRNYGTAGGTVFQLGACE